ncbi:MAG: polyprenyl synthetase family protein [Candidatus Omnitrophica bacterium]|nr:polyprenyl synthetase family protein [Candidatus Omnitrophota bacterium]
MLEHFYSRQNLIESKLKSFLRKKSYPKEVYSLIEEFISLGGKRIRPLLVTSCCSLVGGKEKDCIDAAIAVELFHNFTLIHDDIEDNSTLRRGKPCLHIKYGLPLALNAGDGLFMLVWKAALNIKKYNLEAQKILLDSFTAVLEGQAIELSWYKNNNWEISIQDYLKMVGGKTASLLAGSAKVGALLGGGSKKEQQALFNYGYVLGLAFQIQDDILNLVGDEKKYKKEIGGDIAEGKRTLMVLDCLQKLKKEDSLKLKRILSSKNNSKEEIYWAIEQIKKTDSISFAKNLSFKLAKKAKNYLNIFNDNQEKKDLMDLANFVISRDF